MIPGKAYECILQDEAAINNLTELINSLIRLDAFPDEIAIARLLCLNKNGDEPGTEDAIRPITIVGVLIKLIESPLLEDVRKAGIHKAQIGFKPKLGTELNIMKLKYELYKLNKIKGSRNKRMPMRYILFIDFSQAFDSVSHKILIEKLIKKGVSEETINTIIKLLNSGKVSVDLREIININKGLGQGKLLSPDEFNIFIDDLFEEMEPLCWALLAYADDLAFVFEDKETLLKAIEANDKWSKKNLIKINKKKSGIMIINDVGSECSTIEDYPVVTTYKYLGVTLTSDLLSRSHISLLQGRIKDYLRRNAFLHRKYFTPVSLLELNEYFVKSRLCYGLCAFIQDKTAMTRLNKTLMKHLKSIMGLPDNTPHERLHFTIGEPDIKVRLLVRLLKNSRLYHTHFEEYPELYLKDLLYEFSKEEIEDSENEPEYKIIKMRLTNENLQEKFKKYYDFPLRFNHKEHLKRFFFCFPDKRDFLIIRYFTGTTVASNQRLFPICECGKENRPGHKANECAIALSEDERKDYLETVGKFYDKMKIERKETLHDYLVNIFYQLVSDDETTVRKVSTLVKEIVCKLIYSEKEKDEKEEEERED